MFTHLLHRGKGFTFSPFALKQRPHSPVAQQPINLENPSTKPKLKIIYLNFCQGQSWLLHTLFVSLLQSQATNHVDETGPSMFFQNWPFIYCIALNTDFSRDFQHIGHLFCYTRANQTEGTGSKF